jgi:hypothetical protein
MAKAFAVCLRHGFDLSLDARKHLLHVQRLGLLIHLLGAGKRIALVGFMLHVGENVMEDFPVEPPVEESPTHPHKEGTVDISDHNLLVVDS